MKFGIGQSVKRREDIRLVTGAGRYTDDVAIENVAHAAFVRSSHAHARIRNVDVGAAATAPGVIGVVTKADVDAAGADTMPLDVAPKNRDGTPVPATPKELLPGDKVRFAGEAVVMVVAETPAQAKDAAELVTIDYEPLAAAGTLDAAARGGGAQIWEHAPNNLAFDWIQGDEQACTHGFEKAAHAVSVEVVQNNIVPLPIETRNAIGLYDPASGLYTLHTNSQGVFVNRHVIGDKILKTGKEKLRVLTHDVGGGFGLKQEVFVEQPLVLIAAKKFGRPVKWSGDRTESFLADSHARDARTRGELALDAHGKILALRITGIANMGAYFSQVSPMVPTHFGMGVVGGLYRIPATFIAVKGYFTNTATIAPYRGAGRPEAAFIMDRLMDQAAAALKMEGAEMRRLNLLRPEEFPHRNYVGLNFDSGDGPKNLDDAMKRADWTGFKARRAESLKRGKKRGLGITYYLEIAGGPPVPDKSAIRFTENGAVDVYAGSQSSGQGHETTFAQLLADQLGVPFESVNIRQGDTFFPAFGFGSVGSRSLQTSGNAIGKAGEEVIRKGKLAAGHVLQAGGAEVSFTVTEGVGQFKVAGTGRAISIAELAMTLKREKLPDFEAGLDADAKYAPHSTFPNGCHICEVEVDPDTGKVDVLRYTVVDDLGRIINPMVVAGQMHGGVAQGLGQALMENCVYDENSGQCLTASFMDYGMPRAEDMPPIDFSYNEVLCTTNPLGAKGCGEAGTVGAIPVIVSAVCDALQVAHIDMPLTPEKVWRAARIQ